MDLGHLNGGGNAPVQKVRGVEYHHFLPEGPSHEIGLQMLDIVQAVCPACTSQSLSILQAGVHACMEENKELREEIGKLQSWKQDTENRLSYLMKGGPNK